MLGGTRICEVCESEFGLYPGKPGKINECPGCATDVPIFVAEQGEGDDGTVETMTTKPPVRWMPIQIESQEEED